MLSGVTANAQAPAPLSNSKVTIDQLLEKISYIKSLVQQLTGKSQVLGVQTVATAAEFDAAIKKAVSGDIIYLSPGIYDLDTLSGGTYRITNRVFSDTNPVIIKSALASNPAVIYSGDFQISGTTGLRFENIKITDNQPGRGYSRPMVSVTNSKYITFAGTVFRGYVLKENEGTNISLAPSRDIPISGYPFGGGVHVSNSSYVTLDTVDMADYIIIMFQQYMGIIFCYHFYFSFIINSAFRFHNAGHSHYTFCRTKQTCKCRHIVHAKVGHTTSAILIKECTPCWAGVTILPMCTRYNS